MCFIFLGGKWGFEKNLLVVLCFYFWIIGIMDLGWGRMVVLFCLVMIVSFILGKLGIKKERDICNCINL